jgi:hypothetical protein
MQADGRVEREALVYQTYKTRECEEKPDGGMKEKKENVTIRRRPHKERKRRKGRANGSLNPSSSGPAFVVHICTLNMG